MEETIQGDISFEEKENLISLLIKDFSIPMSSKIQQDLHGKTEMEADNIALNGVSIQDFIDYEEKITGQSLFPYLYFINSYILKLFQSGHFNLISTSPWFILGNRYISVVDEKKYEANPVELNAKLLGFEYIAWKYRNNISLIEVKDSKGDYGVGSGIAINPRTILTAKHVIENYDITQILIGEESYTETDINVSQDRDIALVTIERDIKNFQAIAFCEGRLLDDILAVGYPPVSMTTETPAIHSLGNIVTKTKMNDGTNLMLISSTCRPGNSGGPVFSSSGALVGIVTDHIERKFDKNQIHIDETMHIEEKIESIVKQVNNLMFVAPFYAAISIQDIIERLPQDIANEIKRNDSE